MTDTTRYRRSTGAASAEVDGDIVVISPTDRRCFALNGTSGNVWNLLNSDGGGVTSIDLVEWLTSTYDVDRSTCEAEVAHLLNLMIDAGVVAVVV